MNFILIEMGLAPLHFQCPLKQDEPIQMLYFSHYKLQLLLIMISLTEDKSIAVRLTSLLPDNRKEAEAILYKYRADPSINY
jgi:hypothetical protein